jgi:hypothetical protein
MLSKSYHHLNPLFKVKSYVAYRIDEDRNLNNFEIVVDTNELTRKSINEELLIFHKYQVDRKNMKCPLEWWRKSESVFSIQRLTF